MIDAVSLNAVSRGPAGISRISAETQVNPTASTNTASGADFSTMLANIASDAVDSVKAGEATAISGVQSKASVQQVVEAVMSAEQSLQTAIAVRDKVVAAYQEISRMAI